MQLRKWSITMNDFTEFCNEFSPVENAIQMRSLYRWNGRDVRNKENLSEHTHLVLACLLELWSSFGDSERENVDFEIAVKGCMYHDSLELLRGDILSVTKDLVPGLRDFIDSEEKAFTELIVGKINKKTEELIRLSDLMACYKFIESECRYPSNDFVLDVYFDVKREYDVALSEYKSKYGTTEETEVKVSERFLKGYSEDAGIDIIIDSNLTFMPHKTTVVSLNLSIDVPIGHMCIICPRSSAAKKGISISTSIIDPGYLGNIHAIVHNVSNDILEFKKGESFCQFVIVKVVNLETKVKSNKKREYDNFGSSDIEC